jgi:hypothetical protein
MKKVLITFAILAFITGLVALYVTDKPKGQMAGGGASQSFAYNTTSSATTSVGTSLWATVLAESSGRGYVSFCNESVASNSAIFLRFGATSTPSALGMSGIRVPSGACFEMTQEKMFYGNVFAIASSSTSTLSTVVGSY